MIGDTDGGGSVSDDDIYKGRVKPALVSLSDSYSELDLIFVCVSRLSSNPISHFLLTIALSKE